MTRNQSRRFIIGMIPVVIAGVLLAITHAPFWAGIIAVAVLCFTVLPWVMLADVWKLRHDRFSLDAHREVLIDGEPHVIVGYSFTSGNVSPDKISVDFEPTEQYLNHNRSRDISVAIGSALR